MLTLPQVAATLSATLVAYKTFNAAGQPLLDSPMLNGVLIMVLVTAVLGPVLTQKFAPRLPDENFRSGGVVKAGADTSTE